VRLLLIVSAVGVNRTCAETNSVRISPFLKASPAYQQATLRLMLDEANVYASRLKLPEKLPLTAESLKEKFVAPPHLATGFGALGSLRTTNFSYGFGKGRHLSYIMRLPKDKSNRPLYDRLKPWAIDPARVDTNAAYMMATQFLVNAFVDLPRLSSAKVSIEPMTVLDMTTCIYTVEWQRGGNPIALVTLAKPKAELWTLRVEDPELILRPALSVNLPAGDDTGPTK
jgi:hypothetical protein